MGPTLKFSRDGVIAICGADMQAKLDGQPVPLWESIAVKAGQTLAMSAGQAGRARLYRLRRRHRHAALAGLALDLPQGRRRRHGGPRAEDGPGVPVAGGKGTPGRKVKPECRPTFPTDKTWTIEVVAGPNDDWIDEAGQKRFLTSDWKLSSKSDRTGFRLDGPQWTFTEKAYKKAPENGAEPSNIIDHGYPLGAINLAGQTPIILVNDGPSMGGFINPYTVPSAAFWKLGQSKPGDIYRFKAISVDEAQALRRRSTRSAQPSSIA